MNLVARLPGRTMALYALPTLGLNLMHWIVTVFMLKYATEVMHLSPGLVGLLFAGGRLWDAACDPITGWASDRTRSRIGRRRVWMLSGAIPLGLSFIALWSAPAELSGGAVALWLAGTLFVFYSAKTAAGIPYFALGAELTPDHHERTRLSAVRVGAEIVALFMALGFLHWIENAASMRESMIDSAIIVGGIAVISFLAAGIGLREVPAFQGRGAASPIAGFRDVLRNPHARRLTLALMLSELGLGSLLVALPFITEASDQGGTSALRILCFALPFAVAIPLWVPLGRRFGKARCYTAATGLQALGFAILGFGDDSFAGFAVCMLLIGFAQAALRTFPMSIKADVVDWDEASTKQRKEGTYFAAWEFADKTASALSVALVGFALGGISSEVTPERIRLATSTIPAILLLLAMWVMLGFRLDARMHEAVRARIDADGTPPYRG